jgi:hypothetical protein
MGRFFIKAKRFMPLVSILLIIPGFSEETKPLCEKATKTVNDNDRLVEIKKQLIEKEKELVRRNQALVEKERQIEEREKELAKKEEELQQILSAREELPLSELFDEPLYAQADGQDGQSSFQPIQPTEKKTPQPAPKVNNAAEKCRSPFQTMHVGVRHTEARGVGYKHGYTTLEGFGIYDAHTSLMPFVDLRGHIFDDGDFAGNVGIGARTYLSSMDYVLGAYLYYDVRSRTHRLLPQQLSPGIELLGNRFEYRMNGYFPVGNDESRKYDYKFAEFDEHSIIVKGKQQRIMTGGDAEIGAHITQSTKYDVYAGVGPYYFTVSDRSAWGGKVRLLGRFKQYVSFEASYSYDHLFKSIVQGTVGLSYPFGNKIRRKGKNCSDQVNLALGRAAFAPYRFEIPVVKKITIKEKAINPATDRPWKVWFVNNTSSSSGTFESPFPTLTQAQNASSKFNMIYVFPGDGTTTGMDMGITLQDNQTFFGSGIAHKIRTTKGKIKIPPFSEGSPFITNTSGNVVTLANRNEVSGFNVMTESNFDGILGQSINGTKIYNNSILGNNSSGIVIQGFGSVKIKNNQINNQTHPSSFVYGILIRNTGSMKLKILDNSISNFSEAITISPFQHDPNITGNALVSGNEVANFVQQGINYNQGWSNATVRIIENTIINTFGVSGSHGILANLFLFPNVGTVILSDNQITTTSTSTNTLGIAVQPAASNIQLKTIINNNDVSIGSGSASFGIGVFGNFSVNSNVCASVFDNTVIGAFPGTNGISITSTAPGPNSTTVNVENFSGNIGSNIFISGNVNFVESCDED